MTQVRVTHKTLLQCNTDEIRAPGRQPTASCESVPISNLAVSQTMSQYTHGMHDSASHSKDVSHYTYTQDHAQSISHAIHYNHNTTLTEIQKFSDLKAQLRMTTTDAVEGFPLTRDNNVTAVQLLVDVSGDPTR